MYVETPKKISKITTLLIIGVLYCRKENSKTNISNLGFPLPHRDSPASSPIISQVHTWDCMGWALLLATKLHVCTCDITGLRPGNPYEVLGTISTSY